MPKCAHILTKCSSKHTFLLTLFILLLALFTSCQTTKYVPEGQYLLNKTKVDVDNKSIDKDQLKGYLRQTPNSKVLGFWRLQLHVYNLSGPDTTKRVNRMLRKMGEAPEIYSPYLTEVSQTQLTRAMQNKGYYEAVVDTAVAYDERKVNLTYNVTSGTPYRLRDYETEFENADLQRITTNVQRPLITRDMLFDTDVLENERTRVTSVMRNMGYFYFEKDYLQFIADSAFNSHQIDLKMTLQDYIADAPDSVLNALFTRYKIRDVNFLVDTMKNGKPLVRERTLRKSCFIRPGDYYSERNLERSYAQLNQLGPVKYVNIAFSQVSEDELDCNIVVTKGKLNSVSAEVEGTYSAGDWGVAAGVGYVNRNIFRGAEELSINGRGSYEWRQNGGRAIEAKAEVGLKFPNSLKINVSYNYQKRPEEFTRTVANASMQYLLHRPRSNWYHTFTPLDVSYVYLPWISTRFREEFLQPTNILKYSYEDHFIVDWSYSGSYSSYRSNQPLRSYGTFQYSVETAGNFLYGMSKLFNQVPDSTGAYSLFNIRYAQYAKADVNLVYHQIVNKNHRLVYHAFLGVAVPFGNASSMPFEKRYFAGGANSVRGWTMRSLGPGQYKGNGTRIDFNNQAGDIKLDLNVEYRVHVVWKLDAAAFIDAGNIWTIREYDSQPGGAFHWNSFYKQIALAYGVGLRLDFNFFVFRVDFGVKLHDPSRILEGTQWRTVPNGLCWKDDMTFHFAIGYPF